MPADDKAKFITPPNTLKAKVKIGGPGAVNPEVLDRAEGVIASLADDYLEWVAADLTKIEDAFAKLKAANGDRQGELRVIFEVSHEIKGQGGSFGYDLMTRIGHHLCRFIEGLSAAGKNAGAAEVEVIRLHIDGLKLVIAHKLRGDGGPEGIALLQGLEQVVAKVARG